MLLAKPRIHTKGTVNGTPVKRCSVGGCPSARAIEEGAGHECRMLRIIVRPDIPKFHPDKKCPLPKAPEEKETA